jgi:predicted permease
MSNQSGWRKLLFLTRRRRFDQEVFDQEIREEMQLHLELRARQLREQGTDPIEAEQIARREFGNLTLLREMSREVWIWPSLESAWQDLRFGARQFSRRPGFTVIAVLTLALGIGAATAVFSILDAVLLRPLPYKQPDQLVAIWGRGLHEKGLAKTFLPYTDYEDWSRHANSFESIAVATWAAGSQRILTGRGDARELLVIPVSASFFDTLGVHAVLGRTFTQDDERRGCAVVLSDAFWKATLASDRAIIGQSLTLDERACTVLGIMPATFSFYPPVANMWILLGPDFEPKRQDAAVGVFARLKAGVTREEAQSEIASLHRALHRSGFWADTEPVVYDLHGEFTFLASRTLRVTILVVFAAVLFLLLIACLNVANLLLARLWDRQREFAVRAALGSGKPRIVRQVLAESLLLAVLGTAAGISIAWGAVRYFRFASPIELTVGADVTLNLPVLIFSGFLSIATTLIFGLLPALKSSRIDINQRLKGSGHTAERGPVRYKTANIAIAIEMALTFVLLIGAGLLIRSALQMGTERLGFEPDRVLTTNVTLPKPRYTSTAGRLQFFDSLLERLNGVAGVTHTALASRLPPYASDPTNEAIEVQGRPVPSLRQPHDAGLNAVSPDFFATLDIPFLRGRPFNVADRENSTPVAIVNEALVRKYFPGVDPIGRLIRIDRRDRGTQMPWLTIVGVAGNLKHTELMNEMSWVETPVLYRPLAQDARERIGVAVRVLYISPALGREIQRQISSLDPSTPVADVSPITTEIAKVLTYPRFRALVFSFFAAAALMLSAVGLYGVLSQLVLQRTAEFGVRKAVGAQAMDLIVLVARQGGVAALSGIAAGIGFALAFSRLLGSLLYGIQPADPSVLTLVSAALVVVSGVAMALPAWRAASIDPMVALRDE